MVICYIIHETSALHNPEHDFGQGFERNSLLAGYVLHKTFFQVDANLVEGVNLIRVTLDDWQTDVDSVSEEYPRKGFR